MSESAQTFINDVKAKLCSEIIRKPDFSLRQIAEIAFLLGMNAEIGMSQPEPPPPQPGDTPMTDDPVHNHPDMAWDMAWQPIDTAPKDGTRIVVYCPKLDGPKEIIVAHQRNGTNFPWREDEGNLLQRDQPTHWMPLPPPPNSKE